MFGVINIGGLYMNSLFNNSILENVNKYFLIVSVIILLLGGIMNMFILNNTHKSWKIIIHLKLLLTIVIFSNVLKYVLPEYFLNLLKIVFVTGCIFVSILAKFIREGAFET